MGYNFSSYEKRAEQGVRRLTRWIVDIIVVIVLALFVSRYVGGTFKITGHSMEPVLNSGDVVLIDRISLNLQKLERADVILFKSDKEENKQYVKRIIGLPGETVQIKNGEVYINGKVIDMDTQDSILLAGLAENEIKLGNDEYFVLGDNSTGSEDSRYSNIGNVKLKQIEGIVWYRILPFSARKKIV